MLQHAILGARGQGGLLRLSRLVASQDLWQEGESDFGSDDGFLGAPFAGAVAIRNLGALRLDKNEGEEGEGNERACRRGGDRCLK